jgi:hypothetical protein
VLNFVIRYSPVNHRIRHAAHRVEIISIISLNIEIKNFKKGVNNPIPGAYSLVSEGKLSLFRDDLDLYEGYLFSTDLPPLLEYPPMRNR